MGYLTLVFIDQKRKCIEKEFSGKSDFKIHYVKRA